MKRTLIEPLYEGVHLAILGEHCIAANRSPHQTSEVWDTATSFGRLYRLNSANMAATGDEFIYHENLVFPASVSHGTPMRALILGGGDGGSARRLLQIPGLARILMVELDQAVVDLARRHLAAIHHGSLDDPRLEIRIQDGLTYLGEGEPAERFDLILFDLTDPNGAAAPLYREPFLRACRTALAEGGLLAMHTASPFFQPVRLRELLAVLRAVFPQVHPYFFPAPLYGGWWGMACASITTDPTAISGQTVDRQLHEWGIDGLQYYNGAVHAAQFALPNFLRDLRTGSP